MRLWVVLLLSAGLCGCYASDTMMRSQTVSFDDVIEDTTDKLLVLNILRAKDKAPLHFDEIPAIHESVTTAASLTGVWPFGPNNKSTTRDTVTAGVGVTLAPSFEVDNLATKDFVTGMSTPIDAKFVKYWLDRGLDRRVVLLLFFSAIDITVGNADGKGLHTLRVRNSPRDAIDALYTLPPEHDDSDSAASSLAQSEARICSAQTDFQHYLKLVNNLTSFTAQSSSQKRLVLDSVPLNNADLSRLITTVAGLDATKSSVEYDRKNNTLSLYSVSAPKTALCLSKSQARGADDGDTPCEGANIGTGADPETRKNALSDVESFPEYSAIADAQTQNYCADFGNVIAQLHQASVSADVAASTGGDSGKAAGAATTEVKPQMRMEIRSVGEIIQFLGDLMAYQEAIQAYERVPHGSGQELDTSKLNPVVTFGFCAYAQEAHCGDYFFNISARNTEDYRLRVSYRGDIYYVPRYNRANQWQGLGTVPCSRPGAVPGSDTSCVDHTLEILAVVNQLTDLQRSAQDVQQTPYVSVLP